MAKGKSTDKNKVLKGEVIAVNSTSKAQEFESGLLMGSGTNVQSQQTDAKAVTSNALQYEDEFTGVYGQGKFDQNKRISIIQPPINPLTLEKLVQHNNALGPCIEAMITNIDGTGHEILFNDDADATVAQDVKAFFKEPWPGESFSKQRKDLRKDLETLGYGMLEVIRNPFNNEIAGMRYIEAKTIRLIKLGEAVPVTRTVIRNGKPVKLRYNMRFRRFVQKVGSSFVFFKEFGADPHVDRVTGAWDNEQPVPPENRASEILYFTIYKDINTPYGIPRWIAQIPSILGSRKAEENNLDFFNSGGVPPFILLVGGGVLSPETKQALESGLASNSSAKQRGLVIEAYASGGSIDDNGAVSIQVERFSSEKQNDSMFENYDERSEKRIRGAFRLSPIFVGKLESLNFASAIASYMVGEAQVFRPEREEFDDQINLKIIPELIKATKSKGSFVFRSLPIAINEAKEKIMALKIATDRQLITKGEAVRGLNEAVGLNMKVAEGEEDVLPVMNQRANQEGVTSDSALFEANTSDVTGGKNNKVMPT